MKKHIRIAVVAPVKPLDFFQQVWKGVWGAARELAVFGVRVESHHDDGRDLAGQQRTLAGLLMSPPDALVVAPAHAFALDEQIEELASRGIPVVTFHSDAPGSRRETYVGTDPILSGALACELLLKFMRDWKKVASFPGSLETDHDARRYASFQRELKRLAPGVEEVVCHTGLERLKDSAVRAFREQGGIDGIFAGAGSGPLVAAAMEKAGIRVPCVAFDHTEQVQKFLARGTVSAIVDEKPFHQGYLAVQQAFEAVRGARCSRLQIPSSVVLCANQSLSNDADKLCGGAESMLRHRTLLGVAYQNKWEDAKEQIRTLKETDPLTGMLNRRGFENILENYAAERRPLTILLAGLNIFHRTHGGAGPHISEEAMTNVAQVLQAGLGPQDYCAHLDGEEFCILLPGDSRVRALAMKERIAAVLERTVIAPKTLKLGIQVRIGIASMPTDAISPEDLLVVADRSMQAHRKISAMPDPGPASLLTH